MQGRTITWRRNKNEDQMLLDSKWTHGAHCISCDNYGYTFICSKGCNETNGFEAMPVVYMKVDWRWCLLSRPMTSAGIGEGLIRLQKFTRWARHRWDAKKETNEMKETKEKMAASTGRMDGWLVKSYGGSIDVHLYGEQHSVCTSHYS